MSWKDDSRRRNLKENFSMEEKRTIINLVRNKKCLWDNKSEKYKNQFVKEKCWQEVAEKVNHNITDVKILWNNIRSRFVAERNKEIANKKGGSSYKSRFDLYDDLCFLQAVCGRQAERTGTNFPVGSTLDGSLSPIPSSHKNSDKDDTPVPKRKAVFVPQPQDLPRNTILSELSKFLNTSQPIMDRWITNFGEFISHELNSYNNKDAMELKHQIATVCVNFRSQTNQQ